MQTFRDFDRKLLLNNSRLARNKFGVNVIFPNSGECYTRRDYIQHRLGATFQQLSFLRQVTDAHAKRYMNEDPDTGDQLERTRNAINQASYCLDNLIFNLGSLSDYFGNYLGLYIYGPKFQSLKWNGFVDKTNQIYRGHPFHGLVAHENKDWFNKLHEYRGDIIHRKAILVEVEGFDSSSRHHEHMVDRLDFKISPSLKKYFHLLRAGASNDLISCAETICLRTIKGLSGILDESEKIVFDPSHREFRR
jgi:hypothetical protein